MMIRGETIKYSSRKKKEITKLENEQEDEITKNELGLNRNLPNLNLEQFNRLNEKEDTYMKLEKIKQKESICRYEELGVKPTNYFLA